MSEEIKEKFWITAEELLKKDIKKPDWLVEKIISENAVTMIFAPPKNNKTMFGLYNGVCVSAGLYVLGKYKTKQGRVLYIDEENDEINMKDLLKRIMDGLGIKKCDIDFMIYKDLKLEHKNRPKLRERHKQIIKDYILERKPVLIICDSAVRFMFGNENSSEDVREVFNFIKQFKKDTAWLLLHHTPKNKLDARGSSDWIAQVDDALSLSRLKGKNNFKLSSKASRKNVWIKGDKYQVLGKEDEPLIFEYFGDEEEVEEIKLYEKLAGKIMEWVENNEIIQFTRQEANKQFAGSKKVKGYSLSTITDALNKLVDDSKLERVGNTRNTIYKRI